MNAGLAISHMHSCSSPPTAPAPRSAHGQAMLDRDQVEFFLITDRPDPATCAVMTGHDDFRDSWYELEGAYNSCCLGMLYRVGTRSEAVSRLLAAGPGGAALPGAIVVLGYDALLMRSLLELTDLDFAQDQRRFGKIEDIVLEWLPILIVADEADTDLIAKFSAVSRLRELGVPIDIRFEAGPQIDADGAPARGIQAFFKQHLVRHFPKMF